MKEIKKEAIHGYSMEEMLQCRMMYMQYAAEGNVSTLPDVAKKIIAAIDAEVLRRLTLTVEE